VLCDISESTVREPFIDLRRARIALRQHWPLARMRARPRMSDGKMARGGADASGFTAETDWLLEGEGFEPSVPRRRRARCTRAARDASPRHRETPERRSFASTNSASDLRHTWSAFHMDKAGLEIEIGFGDFEHLAADHGENFPDRPI